VELLNRLYSKGRFLVLPDIIRLEWKGTVVNTLAYYCIELITVLKGFTILSKGLYFNLQIFVISYGVFHWQAFPA
jgi:hypothetical protein